MSNLGWTCPRCGKCWSPTVQACDCTGEGVTVGRADPPQPLIGPLRRRNAMPSAQHVLAVCPYATGGSWRIWLRLQDEDLHLTDEHCDDEASALRAARKQFEDGRGSTMALVVRPDGTYYDYRDRTRGRA